MQQISTYSMRGEGEGGEGGERDFGLKVRKENRLDFSLVTVASTLV